LDITNLGIEQRAWPVRVWIYYTYWLPSKRLVSDNVNIFLLAEADKVVLRQVATRLLSDPTLQMIFLKTHG
jgi:hypothetical protein